MAVVVAAARRAEIPQIAENANGLNLNEITTTFLHFAQNALMPLFNQRAPNRNLFFAIAARGFSPKIVDRVLAQFSQPNGESMSRLGYCQGLDPAELIEMNSRRRKT